MATSEPSTALIKRSTDNALMPPPPPPKRIKRPRNVLDEDEYTDALSHIIARDFFPGLLESQTQQEYLDALESKDNDWIVSAGQRLTQLMTPGPDGRRVRGRRGVFMTPIKNEGTGGETPRGYGGATPRGFGGETPRGFGGETPSSVAGSEYSTASTKTEKRKDIDTANLSLSAFQTKYTSEDNESFNGLLDKQNLKRRDKYGFLWNNNKIPAPRQIAHRAREAKLLAANGAPDKRLALTTGADDTRPAKPDSWKHRPDNELMFGPSSVEDEFETVAQKAEAESRAGPKSVVYDNTRLPPPALPQQPEVPPSPSFSAIQDAMAGRLRNATSEVGYTGNETPRVNGYAFVDEEESENIPQPASTGPSYRDLLAGQTADATPNPFKIKENRAREDLHHRMVEKVSKGKRTVKSDVGKTPLSGYLSSPVPGKIAAALGRTPVGEGLTPAAQKLFDRVGRTPKAGNGNSGVGSGLRNMWTPTPKRKGN